MLACCRQTLFDRDRGQRVVEDAVRVRRIDGRRSRLGDAAFLAGCLGKVTPPLGREEDSAQSDRSWKRAVDQSERPHWATMECLWGVLARLRGPASRSPTPAAPVVASRQVASSPRRTPRPPSRSPFRLSAVRRRPTCPASWPVPCVSLVPRRGCQPPPPAHDPRARAAGAGATRSGQWGRGQLRCVVGDRRCRADDGGDSGAPRERCVSPTRPCVGRWHQGHGGVRAGAGRVGSGHGGG